MQNLDDFILVNKPVGWTSFDVVKYYKIKLKVKKIGHGGTLDPLATGLLIIAINENTKKLNKILGLNKEYEFEILFGLGTETGDMEGKNINQAKVVRIDIKKLEKTLEKLHGSIVLKVPNYSAVKVNGKKLYELARKGNSIKNNDLPTRVNTIYKLKLIKLYLIKNKQIGKLIVECSSGTYVRSLVEKIGELMNIPTVAYNIKRTKIGDYDLNQAISPQLNKINN